MTWDYRVVRREYDDSYGGKVQQYYIHEAYYARGEAKPEMITADGISPIGETAAELLEDLRLMLQAFAKPVLDYETREPLNAAR